MNYRVRRLRFAIPWALLVVAGVVFAWTAVQPPPVFIAAFVAIVVLNAWNRTLVFSVDRRGVRFSRRGSDPTTPLVPWSSIRQVVVWNAGQAGLGTSGESEVGVRLRPDAPLPRGVRSIVHDPAQPDVVAPELRTTIRGLDRDKLAAAVQAHGGGVPLVDA